MTLLGVSRQKKAVAGAFCGCTAFFCLVMCCVPLASDDVEFAALRFSDLKELIRYVLYYGNGRVMGNLASIILSKLPWLGVLVKAVVLSGVIFLVPAILKLRDVTGYLMSFLLFVTMRQALFGQVYTWTSGFANYVLPIWVTLLIVLLLQRYQNLHSGWAKGLWLGVIFVLGVSGQLFVEHCSLMNVLLAGCAVVFLRKNRRSAAPGAVWLIGSVIGLALMLAIPMVFFAEGNRSEGYRSVNFGGFSWLINSTVTVFTKMGAAFPPLGAMAAAGALAGTVWFTRDKRGSRANSVLYACCCGIVVYFFLNEFLLRNTWYIWQQELRKRLTAVCAVLPFVLWAVVLRSLEDRQTRRQIWFLLAAALGSLVPFLVVSPSPARTLFFAYTCTVAAILVFFRYAWARISERWQSRLRFGGRVAAVTACLVLLITFANIAWISGLRATHIRQEMEAGKTEIVIFEDPYTYVHWSGDGCYGRSYYYEQENDIRFTSTDFETWYYSVWLPKNG